MAAVGMDIVGVKPVDVNSVGVVTVGVSVDAVARPRMARSAVHPPDWPAVRDEAIGALDGIEDRVTYPLDLSLGEWHRSRQVIGGLSLTAVADGQVRVRLAPCLLPSLNDQIHRFDAD
jgi:hypothetical protein